MAIAGQKGRSVNPDLFIGMLREGFIALQKGFEFACTPVGQDLVKEGIKSRERAAEIGNAIVKQLAAGWAEFIAAVKGGAV